MSGMEVKMKNFLEAVSRFFRKGASQPTWADITPPMSEKDFGAFIASYASERERAWAEYYQQR